jgi:hypothetical protein
MRKLWLNFAGCEALGMYTWQTAKTPVFKMIKKKKYGTNKAEL